MSDSKRGPRARRLSQLEPTYLQDDFAIALFSVTVAGVRAVERWLEPVIPDWGRAKAASNRGWPTAR